MAAWFAALSKVSKVFCVAIKKGGNLLITSVGGLADLRGSNLRAGSCLC